MPFTFYGKRHMSYAFSLFNVTERVKSFEEETFGLLVVPHWPTQTW